MRENWFYFASGKLNALGRVTGWYTLGLLFIFSLKSILEKYKYIGL